jgi:soluble lytic murein transglycosylase-like protein
MSSKKLVLGGAALCAWLAVPPAAHAQIYSWRDPSGTLVLSSTPRDPAAQLYVVQKSAAVRTTRAGTPRSGAYEDLIIQHSTEQDVNADVVRAVIQVESGYNPLARSIKGAMGLMQLMPATARELGVTNAYDPGQNIRGGIVYLKQLLVRFGHNLELALAAYNAGPEAVTRYGTVPPYRETRNYVHKVRDKAGTTTARPNRLYRVVETVDGKEVIRYSGTPGAGAAIVTPYGR